MKIMKIAALALAAAYLSACDENSERDRDDPVVGPTPAVLVTAVTVSPSEPGLMVGESMQLTATATDVAGEEIFDRSVGWSSEDEDTATVSPSGMLSAIGVGSTRLTAIVDTVAGSTVVTVHSRVPPVEPPAQVDSVEVMPEAATVPEGSSLQFFAVARDASGGVVFGRATRWQAADPGIVLLDPGGRASGLRPGISMLSARVDGAIGEAVLTVIADYPYELLLEVSDGAGGAELFTLDISDPAGVELPMARPLRGARDPVASPDGRRIAYVLSGPWGSLIEVADRDGGNVTRLTQQGEVSDQPAWSPDGSRIAFRRRPVGFGTDIWVMNADDGSAASNLTESHGATNQSSPAWSPPLADGSLRIAYSHSQSGQGHLWSMRADGSDKRQLTSSPSAYDDAPHWSPDGSRIVFTRSDAAIFGDIYVVGSNGGAGGLLMQLAGPLAGGQFAPAWSPDGQLVAFASRHAGDYFQIYSVRADGTLLAQRTFEPVDHLNPAWITRGD